MKTIYLWLWYLLPANPVLVRIVQGGSRRSRHLWVRMGYLGALVTMVVLGLLTGGGMRTGISLTELAKAGTQVFSIVSYGQVALICLLAPVFMAGAIGQEKMGRTYDILLTTPLSNLQIVLGSLMGRLFFVLALLVSGLPLFAVLLIFGGVAIRSVFVSFTVAAMSALVMGSVAMALSVMRAGGRKAIFFFVITVAAYLVVSYTLDSFVLRRVAAVAGLGAQGTTWLTPLHPMLVLEASLNSESYRPPAEDVLGGYSTITRFYLSRPFATFTMLSGLISVVLMAGSALWLRRVGQNQGKQGWWAAIAHRLGLQRNKGRARTARRVWANPVAWREAQTRSNRAGWVFGRLAFAGIGLAAGGVALLLYHVEALPQIRDPFSGMKLKPHETFRLILHMLLLVELTVIVLLAVYLSAGCVSREREEGTLDLILTTPITPRQYIWGKLRGLVSFLAILLAVPLLTVAMVSIYGSIGDWLGWEQARVPHVLINAQGVASTQRVSLMMFESPLLLLMMLVPFVALCVMVGMSWSLKAKGVLGAVVPAVMVIGTLTMVTGFCGYNAAESVPVVGPILNAFSPVTNITMLLNPWERIVDFGEDPSFGRMSLATGAAVAGLGYSLIVYLMLLTMVGGFDQTVRRLGGERG